MKICLLNIFMMVKALGADELKIVFITKCLYNVYNVEQLSWIRFFL